MTAIHPQSMLSSRIYTNNVFKVDETRKVEPVTREKIKLDSLNQLNNEVKYNMVDEGAINLDESSNHNASYTKGKMEAKQGMKESDGCDKSMSFDDRILKSKQNSWYIGCNRLLYSKNCIYFYIGLIIVSIVVFCYSILGYFAKLNELPIVICEITLIIIITFDMLVRVYTTGCQNYFRKWINWLDLLLLILSALTIILYLKLHNLAQQIEDISFALLIFLRNSSQLLRLYILLKNQKEVRKNIEDIIHFDTDFGDKKLENMGIQREGKSNPVLSFVDGNHHTQKNKKDPQLQNLANFQENDIL